MTEKISSYIGLAQRAGAVIYGEDNIEKVLPKLFLVLIDASAGDKYTDRLTKKCQGVCPTLAADSLESALHRGGVKAIGILNASLANQIIALLR